MKTRIEDLKRTLAVLRKISYIPPNFLAAVVSLELELIDLEMEQNEITE